MYSTPCYQQAVSSFPEWGQQNYAGYSARIPGVPSAFQSRQTPTSQWPTTTWMQQPPTVVAPPKAPTPPPCTQVVVSDVKNRREKRDRVVDTLLRIIPTIVRAIVTELQPHREILGPPRETPLTRPPTAQTVVYETRWVRPESGTIVPTLSVQATDASPEPISRALSSSSSDDPELKITLPTTASVGDVLVTPLTMDGATPWPASSTPPKSPVRKPRPCSNCGHVSKEKS